ncbi:MAG: Fur family transcriptional regulator [Minisyncoccia bacterium]
MFKTLLQDKKIPVTKQRLALLNELSQYKIPVTIDTLSQALVGDMNTTTVYRSLALLVSAGVVYQTDFRDGMAYFELQHSNHHHHLVCTQCNQKQDISFCPQKSFSNIEKEHNFTITNHIFEIFGLCKTCTKN